MPYKDRQKQSNYWREHGRRWRARLRTDGRTSRGGPAPQAKRPEPTDAEMDAAALRWLEERTWQTQ